MAFIEYNNNYIENKFVKENVFFALQPEKEELPLYKEIKGKLPEPFWENHESTMQCYWKVWELAFKNLRKPDPKSGFLTNYIDTAFNDCIFMWDTSFILLFARYGYRAFNFQKTFDNFYAKQHTDGFICREIDEKNGYDRFHRFDPVSTGPNIMPFTEWEYYLNFGDKDRLKKVFPVLVAYHQWLREFRTWRDGSYWSSGWGCGMDNQPRVKKPYSQYFSHGHQVWADTCMQQILSAKLLLKIGKEIGRDHEIQDFEAEVGLLSEYVNNKLWDEESSFYYDLWQGNVLNNVKSIGAYWSLLADIIPEDRLDKFIEHLSNKNEFLRPHPIPTLSADHPEYEENGDYWKGGVWAPTNYMVLMGLHKNGYDELAHSIAVRHLKKVVQVFENTGTLWENYAPEKNSQGNPAKADFVGWSGLPPVAVLFEYAFGIKPDVPNSRLEWDIRLTEEHGVNNYPFGESGLLNLKCEKRISTMEKPVIKVCTNIPVNIVLKWEGGEETITIKEN